MTPRTDNYRTHYFRACLITAIVTCIVTLAARTFIHASGSFTELGTHGSRATVTYSIRTPVAQTYRITVPSQDDVVLPSSMTAFPHQTVICDTKGEECTTTADGGAETSWTFESSR
jgi:hypothetical protein